MKEQKKKKKSGKAVVADTPELSSAGYPDTPFKLLFAIFVLFVLLYSASARPYLGSNDGSQFALAASLAREHRFAVNSFVDYTSYWDYAFRDGNYFSERAPGLSLLAVPFIWLGDIMRPIYILGIGADDSAIGYCLLLSAIFGSGTVVLLILIQVHLGISLPSALLCALSFAFGSLNWKYSAIFMNHVPAEFFVLAPLAFVTAKGFWKSEVLQTMFLFFTGIMCLVRLELVLLMPLYLFIYVRRRRDGGEILKLSKLKICSYSCFGPLFVAFFHSVCFGTPWKTFTTFYAPGRNFWAIDPALKVGGGFTLSDMLSHPIGAGLFKIFFQWPGDAPLSVPEAVAGLGAWGMFILQPVLLLSFFGWHTLTKRNRPFACVLMGTVAFIAVFGALNLSIDGGAMRDPRYVIPVLPLMFLPLGYTLDAPRNTTFSFVFRLLFGFLSSVGFIFCAIHLSDTASTAIEPFIRESMARQSLISRGGIGILLESLVPAPSRGIVPFTITLIVGFGIFYLLRKVAEHLDKRNWSTISNSSVSLILATELTLGLGTLYACATPVNRLNFFPDTIRIDEVPATLAVQMSGLTRFFGPNTLITSVRVGDRDCSSGILVSSPSVTRFAVPAAAKQFSAEIGIVESVEISGAPDVTYEIALDGKTVKTVPSIVRGAPRMSVLIPLFDAKTIELKTSSDNKNPNLLSVWCEPHFG